MVCALVPAPVTICENSQMESYMCARDFACGVYSGILAPSETGNLDFPFECQPLAILFPNERCPLPFLLSWSNSPSPVQDIKFINERCGWWGWRAVCDDGRRLVHLWSSLPTTPTPPPAPPPQHPLFLCLKPSAFIITCCIGSSQWRRLDQWALTPGPPHPPPNQC